MKILVTGSQGFIGKRLINKLQKYKIKILAFDIKGSSKNKLRSMIKNVDGIIHLGAISRVSECEKNPLNTFRTNLNFTIEILDMLIKINKKPWLIFSSTKQIQIDYKNNFFGPYSITKDACEKIIKFYSLKYNINSLIVRFSDVYSGNEKNKNKFLPKLIIKMLKNKKFIINNASHEFNYIHVDDICNNISNIIRKNKIKGFNEINLFGKNKYSIEKIANKVKKISKSNSQIITLKKSKKNRIDIKKLKPSLLKKNFLKELQLMIYKYQEKGYSKD